MRRVQNSDGGPTNKYTDQLIRLLSESGIDVKVYLPMPYIIDNAVGDLASLAYPSVNKITFESDSNRLHSV